MRISILDRQRTLSRQTREFAKRRLLFALSRFDSKIDHVSLAVTDVTGPRGRVDKLCQVTVKMRLADIRVSSEAAELEGSIARAADRARRAVSRAVERDRQTV
jgi:ribosome-associated translation inhibitor RaiA